MHTGELPYKFGASSLECGATCLRASCLWGELSVIRHFVLGTLCSRIISVPGHFGPGLFHSLVITAQVHFGSFFFGSGHLGPGSFISQAPEHFRPVSLGLWVILLPGLFVPGTFWSQVILVPVHLAPGNFVPSHFCPGSFRLII